MLNTFFSINMPYGIARNENGDWMAFNREYRPIGYNESSEKLLPGRSYQDLPVYERYVNMKESDLEFLASIGEGNNIERNEKGEIIRVFLYDDGSNPSKSNKDSLWIPYLRKIQLLSTFTNSKIYTPFYNKAKTYVKTKVKRDSK